MANIYCKKFRENHPNVKFEALEDENILITNCWNDDSCTFNFKKSSVLTFFNNLILHEELLRIYHKGKCPICYTIRVVKTKIQC